MSIIATWHHCSTSETLQRSSHTVDVIGTHAYVFGGELIPRTPRDSDLLQIDLNAKGDSNVTQVKPQKTPPPRVGSASAVVHGKIYLFSGRGGQAMTPLDELGSFWVFDPMDLTWSLLTPADPSDPFPEARSYHCAASDGVDSIFIHAGCPASGRLADLWSFNVRSRKWTQHADAPAPPRGGSSIAYAENLLFRMNGFDGEREQGGTIDVYQPNNNVWDFKPFSSDGLSGPTPRSVSLLLPMSINSKPMLVTLFGEGDPSTLGHAGAGLMLDDVWAYDISQETWSKVETKWDYDKMPLARGWFDGAVVDQSTIFLAGGLGEDNERLSDCWLLKF